MPGLADATTIPDSYFEPAPEALDRRIEARRRQLGRRLLILGHHYQRDEVIRHADLRGDSLTLSRMAAHEAPRRGTEFIVFCGVSFMAETADLLTDESVMVLLPNLAAACPMAAMADEEDVSATWDALHRALGPDWRGRIIPVAYVNSTAAAKAFAGRHGGACCTSSNAIEVMRWALAGGVAPGRHDEIKVLFLPDEHLGRNTATRLGLDDVLTLDRGEPGSALDAQSLRAARVVLWPGHCYVHLRFRAEHVDQARAACSATGPVRVIVHPECRQDVVDRADEAAATETIIERVRHSSAGTTWVVGTEAHLVQRLAREVEPRGVRVRMLGERPIMCTQMFRISPQHLLWVLDNLAEGRVVNQVRVDGGLRPPARLAVQRMLEIT